MNEITFAQPVWILIGLIITIGMIIWFVLSDKRNKLALESFITGKLLAKLRSSISRPKRWIKRASLVICTALLFLTLARPQLGHELKEVNRKGIDILFAIDASRSMLAEDIQPNRLERVKMGVMDFVNQLEGDRVGLLPFSGSSFLLCPFTLDYRAFEQSLNAITTEIIPKKGTDLASAINEASSIFEEAGNNHRILVVVTDGEDLQGEALEAANNAVKQNVIVYSLGVGSEEGELIPISHPQYGTDYLKDSSGKLVRTKLDEKGLKKIAEITGGIYAPFGKGGEGLRKIYQEKLSLVPKEELKQRIQKVAIERYQWPLGGAIALLVVSMMIGDRRRLSKKSSLRQQQASVTIVIIFFIVSLVEVRAEDGKEAYNEAIKKYQSGEASDAEGLFQQSIEQSDDLSLQSNSYYNMGNALFKQGATLLSNGDVEETIKLWEKSVTAYEGSLALDTSDEDAEKNREYVQKKIDELKQQKINEDQQQKDQNKKEQKDQDKQEKDEENKGDQSKEEQDEGKQSKSKESKSEQGKSEQSKGNQGKDKSEKGEGGQGKEEKTQSDDAKAQNGDEERPSDENLSEKEGATSLNEERRAAGKMTKEEALQLLKSLEGDEERVLVVPARKGHPSDPDNTTKGKDW